MKRHLLLALCLFCGQLTSAGETAPVEEPLCVELESIAQEISLASTLLDVEQATHVVVRSGKWSDPQTWKEEQIPTAHARVRVPRDMVLTVDGIVKMPLDWLAIEGQVQFSHTQDTRLEVCTILVKRSGKLQVGTKQAPINPNCRAEIVFTPRSTAKFADPYDVAGGMVSLGTVEVFGATKTHFAHSTAAISQGTKSVTLANAVQGWRVGDELLFPAACQSERDERPTIKAISADGKTITLSQALASAHRSPELIGRPIPIGNMTRNVVFRSASVKELTDRGHLILMSHVGNELHGARFEGLGRTSTKKAHTLPEVRDGGKIDNGDNPIGRYAVHFHLRQSATRDLPPQHFVGNVIVDSPKHGLVNHGGYVIAEDNVSYAIHGSHFFAENGSEIGAFRRNLAVYSTGSGDTVRSRDSIYDFGHGGHGFWAQSPAVTIEHNYAFHHAGAAFSIFARPVYEFGQVVFFRSKNLPDHLRASASSELISSGSVPFTFAHNVGGNCAVGLELWNTNTYTESKHESLVEHSAFWDTREHGIFMPYTKDTVIRDTQLLHSSAGDVGATGLMVNQSTGGLTLERMTIAGYHYGVWCPSIGATRIAGCRLDNQVSLQLVTPVAAGRTTKIENNTFGGLLTKPIKDRCDYDLQPLNYSFRGDVSVVFERDELQLNDARFPGQTLYYPQQHPDAIPFADQSLPQLKGKSSQQLWDDFGLAIAGRLAPRTATKHPQVHGWVGAVPVDESNSSGNKPRHAGVKTIDQNLSAVSFVRSENGSGWNIERRKGDAATASTVLTYADNQPPRFELDNRIKLEIHPDDIKHGIMLCGLMYDKIGGVDTLCNMIVEKKDLEVDADGYVTVIHDFVDAVGNIEKKEYRFKVTDQATRRGANLNYYAQKNFNGEAGEQDDLASARPFKRGWIKWLVAGSTMSLAAGAAVLFWRRRR